MTEKYWTVNYVTHDGCSDHLQQETVKDTELLQFIADLKTSDMVSLGYLSMTPHFVFRPDTVETPSQPGETTESLRTSR